MGQATVEPLALQELTVPLFPLHAVLLPHGQLRLRVFEPRYMRMIKECLRDSTPFGICLIHEGGEVGVPAVPRTMGCLATVVEWDMPQLGIFHVTVEGGARFRLLEVPEAAPDGLLSARVGLLPADTLCAVTPAVQPLVKALEVVAQRLAEAEEQSEPCSLEDAGGTGWRLAEELQLPLELRQQLLEMDDPCARIELIARVVAASASQMP